MSGSGDYKKFLEKVSLIVIQTSRIYLVCNKKNTFHSRRYFKNLTSTAIELVHLVTNPTVVASSSIKGNFSRSIFQITVHLCSSIYEQTDLSDKLKKKEKVKVSLNSVCLAQVSGSWTKFKHESKKGSS